MNSYSLLSFVSLVTAFVLGAYTLAKSRAKKSNNIYTFTAFSVCVMFWQAGRFAALSMDAGSTATVFSKASYSFSLLAGAFLFGFIMDHFVFWKSNFVRVPFYVFSGLVAAVVFWSDLFFKAVPAQGWPGTAQGAKLLIGLPFFNGILSMIILTLTLEELFKVNNSPERRNKLIYVISAVTLFFLANIDYLAPLGYNVQPLGSAFVLMSTIVIFYAIINYSLVDFKLAISHLIIFSILYSLIIAVPFYIGAQTQSWSAAASAMFVFASLGPLIYRYFEEKARAVLQQEQKRYQKILMQAASGMINQRDLDKLLRLIVYVIDKTVHVEFTAIYMEDPVTKAYNIRAIRDHNKIPASLTFPPDHILISLLKQKKEPLTYDETKDVLRDFMEKKSVALVIPAFSASKLVGMLFLGEKLNRTLYTEDDISLFKTLVFQGQIAIDNCLTLEEFKRNQEKAFDSGKTISMSGIAECFNPEQDNKEKSQ